MPPDKTDEELQKALWAIPIEDRIWLLIASVIERDGRALSVSTGMLGLLVEMSRGLGSENRRILAARMRDSADHLEGVTRPVGDVQQVVH